MRVSDQPSGVTYCGQEIKIVRQDGEDCVAMSQDAFIEGRLQPMRIDSMRMKDPDLKASDIETTDYRSVVGSLQWLTAQAVPIWLSRLINCRNEIIDLRVRDLQRANRTVREAMKHRYEIVFKLSVPMLKSWPIMMLGFTAVLELKSMRESAMISFMRGTKRSWSILRKGCV